MVKKLLLIVLILGVVVSIPIARRVVGGAQAVTVIVEPLQPRSIQTSVLAAGRLVTKKRST